MNKHVVSVRPEPSIKVVRISRTIARLQAVQTADIHHHVKDALGLKLEDIRANKINAHFFELGEMLCHLNRPRHEIHGGDLITVLGEKRA
jgi:hypothetical protein